MSTIEKIKREVQKLSKCSGFKDIPDVLGEEFLIRL